MGIGAGFVAPEINSLLRLPKSLQSIENNKQAKFGIKIVGQKKMLF
jgi:hypothetical protein